MNRIITVYELLGLIKDDNAPKKIKVLDEIYEYEKYNKFYYNKNGYSLYRLFYEEGNALDIEVEILEEDKPIIEKIEIEEDIVCNKFVRNEYGAKCYIKTHDKIVIEKLNEVIDYINRKENK